MALPLHLAMTAEEFNTCPLPALPAYMACHFSAYGKGLQDLPQALTSRLQEVHKAMSLFAHRADTIGTGQRSNMHQDAAFAHKNTPL